MELFNAPLRYRFDHLDQARAHVVRAGDHSLFFFRHPRLSLAPGSSVQMEWTFQNAEPARMLHGTALETVDRCGVWMELHDTRPLRELRTLHNVRRHALTAKLSGRIPGARTLWTTSYKWTSSHALTPVDMFNTSAGQSEPFLNVFVRQPIPGASSIGRMECLLEVRNLLAQGYLPLISQDGQTLYLVQSSRSIRGGVGFTF